MLPVPSQPSVLLQEWIAAPRHGREAGHSCLWPKGFGTWCGEELQSRALGSRSHILSQPATLSSWEACRMLREGVQPHLPEADGPHHTGELSPPSAAARSLHGLTAQFN